MKSPRRVWWVAALAVCLAFGGVSAAYSQVPGTGIAGSAHDFNGRAAGGTVTTGRCTFCHTPHRGQQTRLLWNHTLSANTYDWSDTTVTTGGTTLQGFDSTWQGPSKFCLSCHDGSVAIGDIAWFNLQAWTGAGALDATTLEGNARQIGTNTGDLMGNHPVAHPFPLSGAANTYNSVTTGAEAVLSGWVADPTANGIRLFNDDGSGNISAGTVAGNTGIECSSCHDPHNGTSVQDVFFLRGEIGGTGVNYICTKCHQK